MNCFIIVISCPFSFNRTLNTAAGVHPQFFNFLTCLDINVISAGQTMFFQANQANFDPPDKMSKAERTLEDRAQSVRELYRGKSIDAEAVLKASAKHYSSEEFMQLYTDNTTPFRNEADRFNPDPGQEEQDDSDSDVEEGEDNPEATAVAPEAPAREPYILPQYKEDYDERLMLLDRDPDMAAHQDSRFDWVESDWTIPAPKPRTEEQMRALYPAEDINYVAINGCMACKTPLTLAVTLACSHLVCIPCFQLPEMVVCPHCEADKRFAATSNVGTLLHLRKDDEDLMEHVYTRPEAKGPPRSDPVQLISDEEMSRALASIDAALRANGVRDPVEYRTLMGANARIRGRKAEARAQAIYDAEGARAMPDEVC